MKERNQNMKYSAEDFIGGLVIALIMALPTIIGLIELLKENMK